MERSLSHTDTSEPYSTGSSSTYASQTYGQDSQVDVNGELGDFSGLAMGGTGMETTVYAAQWLQAEDTTTQPRTPAQYDWVPGSNMAYSGDAFDNSFPFQPFFAEPANTQPDPQDSWAVEGQPRQDQLFTGYSEPSTASTTQEAYFGNISTDEGSISQPGTGLISPQAIFAPSFTNLPDAQLYYPAQPYYPQQYPSFPNGFDPAMYPQAPLPQSALPHPQAYNMAVVHPSEGYLPSRALSRCDSQSSGERIRTKTTLTEEHKIGIYAMSKLPNVRQQDIADKYNIDRSTVSKVIPATRNKEERARNGDVIEPIIKASKGGLARYPEIDAVVAKFIDDRRAEGTTPTDQQLRTLARDAAERLGIDFKASVKWLENFKVRRMSGTVKLNSATSTPVSAPPPPLPVPVSKSYSTTNLSELAEPSQARQRSQSSPQKLGVPQHQRPLPIRQTSQLAFTNVRPTMTRSNSMGGSSRTQRGHRSRASVGSPSLARSAFQLDKPLAPVLEDGSPVRVQSRHRHTRSDAHGLGSWGHMSMSASMGNLQHPAPLYPPIHFQTMPRHPGPSDPKRARLDSRPL